MSLKCRYAKTKSRYKFEKCHHLISSFFFFCKSGVGQRIEEFKFSARDWLVQYWKIFSTHVEDRKLFCDSRILNLKSGVTTFSVDISHQFC